MNLLGLLGVIAAAIVGPLIVAKSTERARRADKREDWARQDEVAARLLARQNEVATIAAQVDQRVEASAAETHDQLNVIHGLVNSTLTSSKQAELKASLGELAMMRRFTPEDTAGIDAAQASVDKLQVELANRADQARSVGGGVTSAGGG